MVSVLVADFQFLTRNGIKAFIEHLEGFEVSGSIDLPDNMVQMAIAQAPDIILVEVSSDDQTVFDKIERVREEGLNVLVLISNPTKGMIQKLHSLNIKGIISKNCKEDEIVSGLKAVSVGNRYYSHDVLDLVMEVRESSNGLEPTSLSPREYEVMELITKGNTTAKIAQKLHLSVHTINSHRKNILKKLNLSSPTEVVVYALESGLVKPETEPKC